MILGFSGTRQGWTVPQAEKVLAVYDFFYKELTEVNHGDCIGSDDAMHRLATKLTPVETVRIWPPIKNKLRAWNSERGNAKILVIEPPMDYLPRDHKIVERCSLLLATPKEGTLSQFLKGYRGPMRGSGTWATIREALRKNKLLHICFADGTTY